MVRRLMAGLEGKRVLDYGCGYGDLTFAISKTNPVVGIDIDPDRVAFAREQYPELEFHEFAGDVAPFPDESFDVVVSCVVLPFVANCKAHICDIRRVLNVGGHLNVATASPPATRSFVRRLLRRESIDSVLHLFKPGETRELLTSSGFVIEGSDYFYDPPFVDWKSTKDVAFDLLPKHFLSARFPQQRRTTRFARDPSHLARIAT